MGKGCEGSFSLLKLGGVFASWQFSQVLMNSSTCE